MSVYAREQYAKGRKDAGYRKDDPMTKNLKAITAGEIREEALKAKRESVNRYKGGTDWDALKAKIKEMIGKYSYQSGILRERGESHLSPTEITNIVKRAID